MERLNKFLAHAGLGSRRHCDDLIVSGRIKPYLVLRMNHELPDASA